MIDAKVLLSDAFRALQAGDARRALDCARRAAEADPRWAPPHLAAGLAHEALGAADAAAAEFERALALEPGFIPAHFALGLQHLARGRWQDAASSFRRVVGSQPRNAEAQQALVNALLAARDVPAAHEAATQARQALPDDPVLLRLAGQSTFLRGDVQGAAELLAACAARDPRDAAVAMLLAQAELLLGRWQAAWSHYALREQRRRFEEARAKAGLEYRVPSLDAVAGKRVTLVAEQGLGDTLFFLRFARELREAGATLDFAGDARLAPLLERSHLFASLRTSSTLDEARAPLPILVADLPLLSSSPEAPFAASLAIAPDRARVESWTRRLEAAGPRPWIGVLWRAGLSTDVLAHGLYKAVPVSPLFAALRPLGGTVVALQRGILPDELDEAARALGKPVADFSGANDDLEDALALVSVLDRHVAVSNTNMHLAAAAGSTADVLVPYPPEWRWRSDGDSPWFPGFRVHRQSPEFDWSRALASLSR